MGKPRRSPVLGFNHNIRHLGRVFHIQTEDSGPINPRIFTHLFFEGTILVSSKKDYDAADHEDNVRLEMKAQHRTMIRQLIQAKFDERIIVFFRARGEELSTVQGATPTATMGETPAPVESTEITVPVEIAPSEELPVAAVASANGAPTPLPSRRHTMAMESVPAHRPAPVVVVRPPEVRRPPFVRSGAPAVATTSSVDGVVVQRSVVVGASPLQAPRPARIRPPVPYVVGGSGTPSPSPSVAAAAVAIAAAPSVAPPGAQNAPVSAVEASRNTAAGFGPGMADDKSLDEVILEYLSDDGD
jgi:hypothetical protein